MENIFFYRIFSFDLIDFFVYIALKIHLFSSTIFHVLTLLYMKLVFLMPYFTKSEKRMSPS